MPSIQINSANIVQFGFKATWNLANRSVAFDTSALTQYTSGGINNVQGISFFLQDQDGLTLTNIDFTNHINYIVPAITQVFNFDLSSVNYAFLFQAYQISAAIKDQNGTVYTIPVFSTTICQPNDFQESGYVCGMFQVRADCINNILTVKEFTVLVYNNLLAQSVTKSGTLAYPTGTISPVTFTNTPFSNNVVITGQYNVNNTTTGTYALPNDIYVLVNYVTMQQFDITCSNQVSDLLCCISELYQTKVKNCDNAIGKRAGQQLEEVELPFFLGLGQEINGQDSEWAYQLIKKQLNCNCGNSALGQNQSTPFNPAVTNIVLVPGGGTSIPTAVVSGNTKTFTISSNVYQVTKGVPGDTSFSITTDTSVPNTVKYVITFNYANLAAAIYTATAASPTLIAQLNALITATSNIDLSNLNGGCIIDLNSNNYFLSYIVPGASTIVTNIVIGANTYAAPGGLIVSNVSGVESWLNGLSLGTFEVNYSTGTGGAYFNVLSNANTHAPVSITLTLSSGPAVATFQSTNKSLIAFLQAVVDYICQQTALQIAMGANLSLCSFDYNGNIVTTNLSTTNTQNDFNTSAASSICNLAARFNTLTGLTCIKLQAIFSDSPTVSFNNGSDRYLSIVGGSCVTLTGFQQAMAFIGAVNLYPAVKSAFCGIDCSVPGTCPGISAASFSAISQTAIGFYGVTWNPSTIANQTVTILYRITGTSSWITSSNNVNLFPNGTINGPSPYQISGLLSGTSYDVSVQNNCGGTSFVTTVTTPAVPISSGSFLLDNVIYNICGDSPVTLYSSIPFATGVTMYTNPGLTTPVTGFLFIANNSGNIYNINTSNGVVGSNTGSTCNTGTPGTYQLGTAIPAVCSATPRTLYTNGAFATGLILYYDSALTEPVTGFTFVANPSTNHIFNLNSSTGLIVSDTGTLCSGTATLTMAFVNAGGSSLFFQANLSRPVDANVAINEIFADGFTTSGCPGSPVASAQSNSTNTILAGSTSIGYPPDSNTGSWASASHHTTYNLRVNGSAHVNGDVITVGSFSVTIVLPGCV